MKSIKRTRGDSHKKTKVTAVAIKLENSRIKNLSKPRKKPKTNPPLIPSASRPPLPSPNVSPTALISPSLPSPNVSPPTLISPSLPTTSPICPHEDTSHCNISNEDDDLEDTHDEVTNGATHDAFTNGPTEDAVTEVIEAAPVVIDLSFKFRKIKQKLSL